MTTKKKWTFLDFGSDNTNYIEDWYQKELSEQAQDKFDDMFKHIQNVEFCRDWPCYKREIKGQPGSEKIWELKFDADKKAFRILGIFVRGEEKKALLLIGCYKKKMRGYHPKSALKTASKRAKLYREGKATIYERQIEEDL